MALYSSFAFPFCYCIKLNGWNVWWIINYDSGDIVAWRPALVKLGDTPDTLFDRVQVVEKANLPFDIDNYAASLG